MDEQSISNMMDKKPEDIIKEAQANSPENQKKDTYDEEPIYNNVQFDRDAVQSKSKSYTVYGQDTISEEIEERIMTLVPLLMKNKYVLRMGGDNHNKLEEAFSPLHMYKEIYLPWGNANKQLAASATRKRPSMYAYRIAVNSFLNSRKEASEEKFNNLPFGVKASLAKDSHLMYGEELNDQVSFVIINTKCGSTSFVRDMDFKALGRASNWIQYAAKFGIKIYNINNDTSYNELKMILASEQTTTTV